MQKNARLLLLISLIFYPSSSPSLLIFMESWKAPPRESRRTQRWEGQPTKGRQRVCSGSSAAVISYLPIQTSPSAWCVRVYRSRTRDRDTESEREREREEEEQARKGPALNYFTYPPSTTGGRGQAKLPIKLARGSRHYLCCKLLTDYMSRSLVHD